MSNKLGRGMSREPVCGVGVGRGGVRGLGRGRVGVVRGVWLVVWFVVVVGLLGVLAGPVLAAAPEVPATRAASVVTGTSAVLSGELNPRSSGVAGFYFEYRVAPPAYEGVYCQGEQVSVTEAEATGVGIAVSQMVEGLQPDTEYAYCVVAVHEGESAQGAALTFKTLAVPPGVVSESGVASTPFEGRIEATVNANNQKTGCVFEYGTTTGYGTRVSCEQATVEGFGEQGVGVSLAHLAPGTTYHFRVFLENASHEHEYGTDATFVTPALVVPVIEEQAAFGATTSSVVLQAHIDPGYQRTGCVFEYGVVAVSEHEVLCARPSLEGGPGQEASVTLVGLTPGSTIHFRVRAANATGSASQLPVSEVTLPLPTAPMVEGVSVSQQTPFELILDANVNPGYEETTCHFEVSTSATELEEGKGISTPCESAPGAGGGSVGVASLPVRGLSPGVSYYFRMVASNAMGTTDGPVSEPFTTETLRAAELEGENASNVTATGARLEVFINPWYQETEYSFEYAETEEAVLKGHGIAVAGGTLPAGSFAAGFSDHTGTGTLTGLTPDRTYYFRADGENATGAIVHALQVSSFTTSSVPTAVTGPVSGAPGTDAAMVSATVNPDGLPTSYQIQYGGPAYGRQTASVLLPAGTTPVPVTVSLEGLQPGIAYHYRVIATNVNGETTQSAFGEDATFTTAGSLPGPPPVGVAPPSPAPAELSSPLVQPDTPVLLTVPAVAFPNGESSSPPGSPLTSAQKLKKALAACHKDKKTSKRRSCEQAARRKYGPEKKAKK